MSECLKECRASSGAVMGVDSCNIKEYLKEGKEIQILVIRQTRRLEML